MTFGAPTAVNAQCGHACAQVPLQQKNYLTCLMLKNSRALAFIMSPWREKRTSWLIFFGWFPGEGFLKKQEKQKTKQCFSVWGNALSAKCFAGLLTQWQASFILENQAWLHIHSGDMLTHYVCCLDLSFIYRKSSPMNLYCVKACFYSCSFFFTCKSHSHLDTCVSPPGGKRRFNWCVQM